MKSYFRSAAAAMIASVLALGGCDPDPKETQINLRIKSPDGKLEAIYASDVSGGAAVGVSEDIYVVESGRFPRLKERVFGEECVNDIELTWDEPRILRISYDIDSGIREDARLSEPSVFSIFSSAYWTYNHPHGVQVRLARRLTPPGDGC